MDTILETVKHVAIFVLVFSIITNLFSGSSYHRYFRFVEGLMIIILVMTPLFAWFTSENFLDDCLDNNIFELENGFQQEELRMIGEEREELLKKDPRRAQGRRGTMRPDEWKDRLRELVQKAGIFKILIVILSGILLIFLSWGGMSEKETSRKEKETVTGTEEEQGNDLLGYQARMEEQVEDILGRAEGIDDVDVMITLRASREKVTLKDNKRDADKSEEESVLTEDENKKTSPYVIQEVEPEIEGILVVCAGGDNPSVQREIIAGISALFPVESHKIKVMKSKEK